MSPVDAPSLRATETGRAVARRRIARVTPRRTGGEAGSWWLSAAWGALLLNVLAFTGELMLFPVPVALGQAVTQGSLWIALAIALVVNPRVLLRPNLFLVLLSVLAVVALMVSIHNVFVVGSTYRAVRLLGFVSVLWLLTPWWGRSDLMLLHVHRRCLWVVLATVVLGAVASPGAAFAFDGRLSGILWPIPPTQVAHYAAVVLGTTAVMWVCRVIEARSAIVGVALSTAILLATHTRTALLAAVFGLVLAVASLFLGHARARRTSATGVVLGLLAATAFAPQVLSWLRRGQDAQETTQLTGRTKVWQAVFDHPRPELNNLFGSGLSNRSFDGLPIDSNWVATFLDQGWFGIVVEAAILLLLLLMAAVHVSGCARAVALFLIGYCLVASVTETGLGDASPYLLDLTVAAALLAPRLRRGPGTRPGARPR